nr:zf-CCHC domain-containing protein/UBN2 domain-containing protein [Tanacetum cinerariifolium]
MCEMAKAICQSLLITRQESIDSGFTRFNTIITSLKALDEGFSSKNYVKKFLKALHPKWRTKVPTIKESKDLSSLALDELIRNLKVHEVVMEKDSEIYRGKKERVKSIALKAKKESSDDKTLTSRSDDEEYAMAVRSDRKCFRRGDPNHLIGDCPKPTRNKDQKAFIGGSWSDSKNDTEDKMSDETCLMAQSSNKTPKKVSPAKQYIFQRRTHASTEPSGHDESSLIYAALGLTDSASKSDDEVPPVVEVEAQDEGHAGPNLGVLTEGRAGSDLGDDAEPQPQSSLVVHVGPNLEYMDLEATDVSTHLHLEQMDEGFTATAYPNVHENLKLTVEEQVILEKPASFTGTLSSLQHLEKDFSFGDLFFNDKPFEAENEKTTAETEAELMVSVTIQQNTSAIPPMTTPVIDLTSRPDSPNVHRPLQATTTETTTTTTTTTTHPPPPQPQQSTIDSIRGAHLYTLENLDTPQQVSKVVDEIVTDAVDWAIQASLRNHFRDLPEADMKEILHQRIWETNSYKAHEDHMMLYEALEKSMNRDHTNELLKDLAEARRKNKKRRSLGAYRSSQVSPPPLSPPSTNQEGQSHGSTAPSSSKTDASTEYTAWTTTNTRLRPYVSSILEDLHMDEDMAHDEHVHSSDDEDTGNAHIPKASALASTYTPLPEDSLLAQTGDMAMFMDWFCKRQVSNGRMPQTTNDSVDESIIRHNVSKPLPLGGPPGQVTIQSDFFFNKDLEYLRYGSKGGRPMLSISKMKATYYPDVGLEKIVPDQMWIEEECKYTSEGDHRAVRTHMRILCVVRIKVFSMYGYDFMKKIVLHRADLNKHTIAERDFKYLYPSDLEDLSLLNLQGHLNHLPPKDKKIFTTAVNLWTRHLVIRQRVEDFQLGIKSYQTQLNLTKPRWDATGFEYKYDFTVIESPRAVTFRDKYEVQMIMRFNEIHKFSDDTLHQIDEALDYQVKEFKEPMKNQPLPTDASPTALSPDYFVDSDPEKDEKDHKEDPADYPADRGNNDKDESSNDDDDDDDVEKDEEDKEEEEHLAPADPSDVSTDDLETMTTVNQGMSVEEIEQVVAQRVANAIEAIAIYETKTNLAHKSMSQTKQQEEEVAENASNKRKWESNHNGRLSQQTKDIRVRASKPKTMQDAIEIAKTKEQKGQHSS